MNNKDVLAIAKTELMALRDKIIDVVDISKPSSLGYAKQLSKVISKLSPLIGNMIEFSTVDLLNAYNWGSHGSWVRQDPGFPDALFESHTIIPNPGVEIKAWFPLATEITARFKDSVTMFHNDNIDVALIAWLPENIIWGKPKVVDVLVVSGRSVAEARDAHYHNPPDYLVFEPEDTSERTSNLQQTNTNGYKFQTDKSNFDEAAQMVEQWGANAKLYSTAKEYQDKLKYLRGQFKYRSDTNYGKIDRIQHDGIEEFKTSVLGRKQQGMTLNDWVSALTSESNDILERTLSSLF